MTKKKLSRRVPAGNGIAPVLFQYSADTLPQHVTANPAPLHAQGFTLG